MTNYYSAIIESGSSSDYWDGTESWAGELNETNRDNKYSTRVYSSASAWEVARDGSGAGAGDKEIGVVIGPWTLRDTTRLYVTDFDAEEWQLICPKTLPDGDNAAAHDGKFENVTNSYTLEDSAAESVYSTDGIGTIEGIQMYSAVNYKAAVRLRGTSQTYYVKKCIVASNYSTADGISDVSATTNTIYVENCIVEGTQTNSGRQGIDLSNGTSSGHVINCTVFNLTNSGISTTAATGVKVRNCAVADTANDFSTVTDIEYCASDDTESGTGNIDWDAGATDWAANFTDYTNGDFTPLNADLVGAGVGSGTDSDVPTEDILGAARSSTAPTIGAFEYPEDAGGLSIPIAMYHYRQRRTT